MSVACPYCQHRMRLKGRHPGRFKPHCDRCDKQFLLVIAADPDVAPMVMPLEKERPSAEPGHPPASGDLR